MVGWGSCRLPPPAVEATIKVICQKLADEGGQPTRGSSEDEDEYWDEDEDEYKHTNKGGQPTRGQGYYLK